jgi:hypothetical protein
MVLKGIIEMKERYGENEVNKHRYKIQYFLGKEGLLGTLHYFLYTKLMKSIGMLHDENFACLLIG